MLRLIERARAGTGDPEIFAGLVHACRYCGLLDAAVSAYQHARRLDPDVRTSIGHAYWMLGECEKAIESDQERVMSHQWAEPSNLRSPPSRCAIVIVEEPAESLAATNATDVPLWKHRVDEFVAETLVIPLVVVMLDELRDRPSQVAFSATTSGAPARAADPAPSRSG